MMPLKNKTLLITGGTGTIGQAVAKYALEKEAERVIIYSRDEYKQHLMRDKFKSDKIKFVIGDVKDFNRLLLASKNAQIIFHTAAMKRVEACEEHYEEAVKTNINGTINVINAAIMNGAETVINMSTDKVTNPVGIYGMTKEINEHIIFNANKDSSIRFMNIRSCNVLWSNGSVAEIFEKKLSNNEKVTVFGDSMKRMFVTPRQVAELFYFALQNGEGGEVFLRKTGSVRITDLAETMKELIGKGSIEIKEMLRGGERQEDFLLSEKEAKRTYYLEEDILMIFPEELEKKTKHNLSKRFDMEYYSTHNAPTLEKEEIIELLLKDVGEEKLEQYTPVNIPIGNKYLN